MTTVTLIYPYFHPQHDKSVFRLPPLGLGYIVSYLRMYGISANLVDCTFMNKREALERVRSSDPKIIGIYSMFSMKAPAMELAKALRNDCEILVAGGPLPTLRPEDFLKDFDVSVVGEAERTMLELVQAFEDHRPLSTINGIVYNARESSDSSVVYTRPREFIDNLDSLPFPTRDSFDNRSYKEHYFKRFGYTTTSLITSRGCPFNCDFCSKSVFGNRFRTRSAPNIVEEMESLHDLGYERAWFADDCFTLDKKRLFGICDEIARRRLEMDWECLSRVDAIDKETALKMKEAGCVRVFFGIESGSDAVLALMKKQITAGQAKKAVFTTKSAGIQVGAFFIVGYPGETDTTILDTLRFVASLPLDYLSFTLPYPIPGTPLYERVRGSIELDDFDQSKHRSLMEHKLLYRSAFSEAKLQFAILKASAQFRLRKLLGARGYRFLGKPFERLTDRVFTLMP